MSLAGFKKQLNKANQFMSEKLGSVKGSKLDEDFVDLERRTDVVNTFVDLMQHKTKEYLQPNPSARTKLNIQTAYLKARGQAKDLKYPQPENNLADVLSKAGQDLGDDSPWSEALNDLGEGFNQMAEIKDALEYSVKQNVLDPLDQLQNKDLREIMHHRKKLEGRRLDFDCKKRKGEKVPKEELRMAEDKFVESKELCYSSMMNLMESDVEHIGQLYAFTEALRDYHKQCADVCESLVDKLNEKMSEAASRPKAERKSFVPRHDDSDEGSDHGIHMTNSSPTRSRPPSSAPSAPLISAPTKVPQCKALYDFEPENEGELGFREGDVILLTSQIDENWFEGTFNGQSGFFPVNYVDVIVPL